MADRSCGWYWRADINHAISADRYRRKALYIPLDAAAASLAKSSSFLTILARPHRYCVTHPQPTKALYSSGPIYKKRAKKKKRGRPLLFFAQYLLGTLFYDPAFTRRKWLILQLYRHSATIALFQSTLQWQAQTAIVFPFFSRLGKENKRKRRNSGGMPISIHTTRGEISASWLRNHCRLTTWCTTERCQHVVPLTGSPLRDERVCAIQRWQTAFELYYRAIPRTRTVQSKPCEIRI